jgi:hypothetical protein
MDTDFPRINTDLKALEVGSNVDDANLSVCIRGKSVSIRVHSGNPTRTHKAFQTPHT